MNPAREQEVCDIFRRIGAFATGHFALRGGGHSDTYINKRMLYLPCYAHELFRISAFMAGEFMGLDADTVVGPAEGARVLADHVALCLGILDERKIASVCAEKSAEQGTFYLKPEDAAHIRNKRVIIVEDILTTGGSVEMVADLLRANGADILGIAAIIHRGNCDFPGLIALARLPLASWTKDECPLCAQGIRIDAAPGKEKDAPPIAASSHK